MEKKKGGVGGDKKKIKINGAGFISASRSFHVGPEAMGTKSQQSISVVTNDWWFSACCTGYPESKYISEHQ